MKKSKIKPRKSSRREQTPELPQNIIPVGERVLDDKNIYIHQKVYNEIHKFAQNKTENEHGGILVGRVLNEMGKENTIIEGFIEAKYNNATPTTLTFTHDTWEHFHSEMERRFKGKKIVGWIHTHPNFGIFLSENDKFIQTNFFTDKNQVAYVVDPIQKEEGFFFWIDEKLERCPGFYLFEKNGTKIKQKPWKSEDGTYEDVVYEQPKSMKFLIFALIVALLANMTATVIMAMKLNTLEKQVEDQNFVFEQCIIPSITMGYPMSVSDLADYIRQEQARAEAEAKAQAEAEAKAQAEAEKNNTDSKATDGNSAGNAETKVENNNNVVKE